MDGPRAVNSGGYVSPLKEGLASESETIGSTQIPSESAPAQEEFEIPDKPDLSKLPSLDIDPSLEPTPTPKPTRRIASPGTQSSSEAPESSSDEDPASSTERTNARAKPSLSSIERRRRNFTRFMLISALIGSGVGGYYLSTMDKEGEVKVQDDRGAWEKFKGNFSELMDTFNKPAFEKLLPDPLPAPHQRPYTLLIDLEDMLVHSTWDRQHGWRTAKRPGVDYFLAYLSQFYELVLFTSQPLYTAMGVADKLDPFQAYLPYKLFRESTRAVNGKVVKDLSFLNRDLSKVILLDINPEHAALQPENAIIIPKWDGTPGDKGLVEMIPFLESIGIFLPADVRPIIKSYEGKNLPLEYAKREAEQKQAAIAQWEREHGGVAYGSGGGGGGGGSWLGRAFGGLSGQPAQSKPTQPMTYLEQKRAQAQAVYNEEQDYWRKNAENIKKLIEEDRQRQLAEQKGSLISWIGGKPAPPPEGQAQTGKA